MENLKVTLVQSDVIWENVEANIEKYNSMLAGVESTDLIILPEMCTTGFSMEIEKLKEPMDGKSVGWMKQLAQEKNSAMVGSLIIEESGKVYNRAVWAFPDGAVSTYDKRHLYTMGQENEHYTAGISKTIVKFRGWKFSPLICYDLRFPVWARNTEDYDVLLYMANWPTPRHHVWKNLLVARAIENQCYCFGVNRLGTDGAGLKYVGDSAYVSPKGLAEFMGEKEGIQAFEISYSELQNFRLSFPLLADRDEFEVKL